MRVHRLYVCLSCGVSNILSWNTFEKWLIRSNVLNNEVFVEQIITTSKNQKIFKFNKYVLYFKLLTVSFQVANWYGKNDCVSDKLEKSFCHLDEQF